MISSTSNSTFGEKRARVDERETHGDRRDHTLRVIHRVPRSAERNAPVLLERLLAPGVRGGGIGHPAGEVTGRDGVDPDAEVSTGKLGGELVREGDGRGPAELITSMKPVRIREGGLLGQGGNLLSGVVVELSSLRRLGDT